MRYDFLALRTILVGAALFAVAMAVTWGAVSAGIDEAIVPRPETTAEGLLRAMKAHRYEAAHELLAEDAQQQASEEDLRELGAALEKRHGEISEAHGQGQEEQGESATGTVLVEFNGGEEQELTFPLEKEDGLWAITSIEPLQALAR